MLLPRGGGGAHAAISGIAWMGRHAMHLASTGRVSCGFPGEEANHGQAVAAEEPFADPWPAEFFPVFLKNSSRFA